MCEITDSLNTDYKQALTDIIMQLCSKCHIHAYLKQKNTEDKNFFAEIEILQFSGYLLTHPRIYIYIYMCVCVCVYLCMYMYNIS